MRRHTIILGVWFAVVSCGFAETPTAKQIFDKRKALKEKISSVVAKYEMVSTYNYPTENWRGEMNHLLGIRYDGNRNKSTEYVWGQVNRRSPNVSREEAEYTSGLWDGQRMYYYSRGKPSNKGAVYITDKDNPRFNPKDTNLVKWSYPGMIFGYQTGDNETIGELMLKHPQKVQVTETVLDSHGGKCYKIEAEVKGKGRYTLWIDPEKDYHIARVRIQRAPGDLMNRNRLKEGDFYRVVYEVLEYMKVGDVWYPKKCRLRSKKKFFGKPSTSERVVTFTELVLNPDHEKLRSFRPDDVPDGTPVLFPNGNREEKFIWQDGKAVPAAAQIDEPRRGRAKSDEPKEESGKVKSTVSCN